MLYCLDLLPFPNNGFPSLHRPAVKHLWPNSTSATVSAVSARNSKDIFLSSAACLNVIGFPHHSHEFNSSACHSFPRGTHTMPMGINVFGYISRCTRRGLGATGAVRSFVFGAS